MEHSEGGWSRKAAAARQNRGTPRKEKLLPSLPHPLKLCFKQAKLPESSSGRSCGYQSYLLSALGTHGLVGESQHTVQEQ